MKKIALSICLLILLAGCNNQQQENQNNSNQATKVEKKEEIIKSDSTIEKSNSEDDSIEEKSNLETYNPSEQVNKNLEEFLDKLSIALMRGDAELAPTYEETIIKVSESQTKLQKTINLFETESAGKNVSNDLNNSFSKFKKTNDELSMALTRGDAELAPTYEEFMMNMGNIIYEFRKAYEEYKNNAEKQILNPADKTVNLSTEVGEKDVIFFEIKELNLKFPVEKITTDDIEYRIENEGAVFISKKLKGKEEYCITEVFLSKLKGKPSDYPDTLISLNPDNFKQFDDFFIKITGPQSVCSDDKNINNLASNFVKDIIEEMINVEIIN